MTDDLKSHRLLTVDDVMAELRVHRSTAYEYMAQMTRVLVGRHVRVTREALDEWICLRTVKPAGPRVVEVLATPARRVAEVAPPERRVLTLSDGSLFDTAPQLRLRRKAKGA